MRNRLPLLFAAVLVAASASALAPTTLSYQGRLEDSGGNPITAVVALKFTIYNDPVANAAANIKWTETHPTVSVTDGLFNVLLGSVIALPDTVFKQPNRWLGITVDLDPEITPRTPFSSVAFAQRVHTVDGSNGGTILGNVNVSDAVIVGDIFGSGVVETYSPVLGGTGVRLFESMGAPRVWVFGEDGNLGIQSDADVDGSGGYLRVFSGGGGSAITFDGNGDGDNSPIVTIDGSGAVIVFDPDTLGNTSVQLPTSAISDVEIRDEPGLAHNNTTTVGLPATTYSNILSRSITCPTTGYVLVIATAEVSVAHSTGTNSTAWLGVSDASGALPVNQDVDVIIPAAAPSGTYDHAFTSHGVFSVSSGSSTFYFVGYESTGSFTINDVNLTLLFVPTLYGVFSSPAPPAPGDNDDNVNAVTRGPLTQAEIEAEQREAEAFDRARLQAELDAMKVQMARFEERLRTAQAAQTPTPAER